MSELMCVFQMRHEPGPLTIERHHVIPVAWQLFWQPSTAPFPGVDPDGRGDLWDARTVSPCPTHHRNVHALIVELMHSVDRTGVEAVPEVAGTAVRRRPEWVTAQLALSRFMAVGGSLLALAAAGEWGEA